MRTYHRSVWARWRAMRWTYTGEPLRYEAQGRLACGEVRAWRRGVRT